MSADEFTTHIEFHPGYDHREEAHNKGCASATMTLVLVGPLAVVTTEILTGWMSAPLVSPYLSVKHATPPWPRKDAPGPDASRGDPMAGGTFLHSPTQTLAWWPGGTPCPYFDGEPCYGDVGYMVSDPVFKALVSEGHDAAFAQMREIYDSWTAPEAGAS